MKKVSTKWLEITFYGNVKKGNISIDKCHEMKKMKLSEYNTIIHLLVQSGLNTKLIPSTFLCYFGIHSIFLLSLIVSNSNSQQWLEIFALHLSIHTFYKILTL